MPIKKVFIILGLILAIILPSLSYANEQPLPPSEVIDWLDYALKRFPPDDCPYLDKETKKCASITRFGLSGNLKEGHVSIELTGYNWSRKDQTINILGPSSSFALTDTKIELKEQLDPLANDDIFIAPFFDATGGYWKVTVPPGKFLITTKMSFEPQASLSLNLANNIGHVDVSKLDGGFLQYDEITGNHGGSVQLILEGKKKTSEEKPQIRVTRVFTWDSIPTFRYSISVSGIQTDTPLSFPLLKDEFIEDVTPKRSYQVTEKDGLRYLQTTFSPNQPTLTVTGHYKHKPTSFTLGETLPFEVWLFISSRRYPVNVQTNANPIDPGEFLSLTNINNASAYLVKPGQKMAFYPITLEVDEGRKGKGNITYKLFEGYQDYWLEKLFLTATLSGQDRLVIPTPNTPTFAGLGDDSLELYHDDNNQLSVRLPSSGLDTKPIIVDWNQLRPVSKLLNKFTFQFPAQNIFLEEQNINIYFKPGHIPLHAWGASIISGGVVNQFHLYGFLIGIFVFFVCRGLKFNFFLSLFVTLLFIGLYPIKSFPLVWVLVSLIMTIPFARASKKLPLSTFITILWLIIFGITTYQLANYSRDRIYTAFHPYADAQSQYHFDNNRSTSKMDYKKVKATKGFPTERSVSEAVYEEMEDLAAAPVQNVLNNQPTQLDQRLMKSNEWTAKPVSLKNYIRGGEVVTLTSYNLLPGKNTKVGVLTAGPVLRAIWLLIETLLILLMMLALLNRLKNVFTVKE
ncbi:MAG: hypothetical protein ABII18_09965 [bacterium]|nr:hypothetical protein [bacterium]